MSGEQQNLQADDAGELVELLLEQTATLKAIYWDCTETPGQYAKVGEITTFILMQAFNIQELAAAATTLIRAHRPFATVVLARSALEGLFCLAASCKDPNFAVQRLSYELDDLAAKLKLLIKLDVWSESWQPTPQGCIDAAATVRSKYGVEAKPWKQIEQVAAKAELSVFYDDEYRLLSLGVHSNYAGILNAGSGYLVRKGLLGISVSVHLASSSIANAFKVSEKHRETLTRQRERMEILLKRPFPMSPQISQMFQTGVANDASS